MADERIKSIKIGWQQEMSMTFKSNEHFISNIFRIFPDDSPVVLKWPSLKSNIKSQIMSTCITTITSAKVNPVLGQEKQVKYKSKIKVLPEKSHI